MIPKISIKHNYKFNSKQRNYMKTFSDNSDGMTKGMTLFSRKGLFFKLKAVKLENVLQNLSKTKNI